MNNNRLIFSLVGVFCLILITIVSAGIGGVALVDAVRAYVAGEGLYSKAHKGAVLALHRYAETRRREDFTTYERLILVPKSDGLAREILEDGSRPQEESYGFLERGNNHPDDVAALAWMFRVFGDTPLFAPPIEIWREADLKVVKLDAVANELHRAVELGNVPEGRVRSYLSRIDAIDEQLTALELAFSQTMGEAARRLAEMLYAGIAGLGSALTLAAIGFAVLTVRRANAVSDQLKYRETRFRDLVELTTDWIWETDSSLRLSYVSDRLEGVTRLPREYFLGRPLKEFCGSLRSTCREEHIAATESRERLINVEYTLTDAFGVKCIFLVNGKPNYSESGKFLGYRGTGTDITAEVTARCEAEQRRELLETSFENLGQGISVVDAELNVVFYNRRLMELLDLPEDNFRIGDPLEKFLRFNAERGEYGVGDVDSLIRARLAAAPTSKPNNLERMRPNGTMIEMRGQPLPSGGFVRTYRDVTIERQAQASLKESERQTREVIDRSLDAYVGVDLTEVIVDWNPAAEQIFGWTRGEAVGKPFIDLIVPVRFRSLCRAALRKHTRTGRSAYVGRRFEHAARRKSGEVFPIELAVNTQNIDGRTVFNAFVRDITERKEAERRLRLSKEEAEVANQAKSEFLANMSHELRTPLNAIIGFSDVMAKRLMGPINDRYLEYAVDIRESGDHLLALINDILDISRVDAAKATIELIPVNLFTITETCLNLLQYSAAANGVTLRNEIPEDAPELLADPRRLRQILLNLVGNAIKFSPCSETVVCQVNETAPGLIYEVVDRGIGMEPQQVEQAFEPFVQLKSGLDRSHEGAGLGLALAKRFVELHGGTIALESQLDEGTTARIFFPEESVRRGALELSNQERLHVERGHSV